MRGWEGSWSPPNVAAGCPPAQGSRPFQAWNYAGFRGLLEPTERNRLPRREPPCPVPFQARDRGGCASTPTQLRMPGVPGQARGRVGFVGAPLKRRTSLRSLGNTRVGVGAIEGPNAFAGVCVPCVRVLGGKASKDRGPGKPGPSMYAWEHLGLPRPRCAVRIGLACLPTKPTSWLCSFGSCGLGQSSGGLEASFLRQSLRSTVPLGGEQDGQRPPGGLFPQLAGGSFASPGPPSNRQRTLKGPLPPLVVLAGFTFGFTSSSSVLPPRPLKGSAGRASSSSACLSCPLSEAAHGKPWSVIVRHRQFSGLAPKGAALRASSSSLHWKGALLPPRPSLQSSGL